MKWKKKKFKRVVSVNGTSRSKVYDFLVLMDAVSEMKDFDLDIVLKVKVMKDHSINLKIVMTGTDELKLHAMYGYFQNESNKF